MCHVEDNGSLSGCRVVQEIPSGSGYAAAVMSLASSYTRKPPTRKDPREIGISASWYPMDVGPDWRRRPTSDDLLAVFPSGAIKKGISGQATISCIATTQGALNSCVALSESPPNTGFGAAAIALTPQFMMKPATLKGVAVPSEVRIPINFHLPSGGMETMGNRKVVPPSLGWAEAPSYADVAAAYPRKARDQKIGGRATVACAMNEDGRLKSCYTAASSPKGYGFEDAAKALAKRFRFEVTTDADRKAVHSVIVHLPVSFDPEMLREATPVVGKPNWVKLPDADVVDRAFADLDIKGTVRAVLSCIVVQGGGVADCKIASEEAPGVGAAALKLAPSFRVTTWSAEGLPVVGGVIRIPVRYKRDAEPTVATPPK
jgi:TonB family protein